MTRSLILLTAVLASSGVSAADWTLDGEHSTVSFVSLKNVDGAEAHRFPGLKGAVDDSGAFSVTIDLDQVDTSVPIRNERMREFLFETAQFPTARASGELDLAAIEALVPGASMTSEVRFTLEFHGSETPLVTEVEVTHAAAGVLQVATRKPILLNAERLGVGGGVKKLQELAGLDSISLAVPVYFTLRFTSGS